MPPIFVDAGDQTGAYACSRNEFASTLASIQARDSLTSTAAIDWRPVDVKDSVVCPNCDSVFKVSRENEGRRVKCSECDQPFVIKFSDEKPQTAVESPFGSTPTNNTPPIVKPPPLPVERSEGDKNHNSRSSNPDYGEIPRKNSWILKIGLIHLGWALVAAFLIAVLSSRQKAELSGELKENSEPSTPALRPESPLVDTREQRSAPRSSLPGSDSFRGVGQNVITKEMYDRIQPGMSYRQVVSIIGIEGIEQSRNRMEGVPGFMPSVDTVMYSWQNRFGSNMNAIFQNDRLFQKAQFGLK